MNLFTLLLGPLAGPECRRALGRGWLIVVRCLAASAVVFVALSVIWFWWIAQRFDPSHLPYAELRFGLATVEGMLVTVALVLGPALLAGSLAGEKERGSMALLLTTRVSAREIVTGRVIGKLTQVGMILLAGAPALVLLGALAGLSPSVLLVAMLLPVAVGIGGGGLSAAASVLSRRGRDALLAVYLADVVLLLAPLSKNLGLPAFELDWIAPVMPYYGLQSLMFEESLTLGLRSIFYWSLFGLVGTAVAAWRLRPSSLAASDGERVTGRRGHRGFVPPLDEKRPMFWKELFIERVATLGRFGRVIGGILVIALSAGSLGLTGVILLNFMRGNDPDVVSWAKDQLETWVGSTGWVLSALIQWAIGIRAAVSISSERERGTWDALLTSPLEAGEIVRGKVWGSLYAIRWLIVASFLAWVLSAATGAIRADSALLWVFEVLVIGAFMAAVGVRTSLSCQTATRAMSLTIGIWLGAYVAVRVFAILVISSIFLLCNAAIIAASQFGITTPAATAFWSPIPWSVAWPLTTNLIYLGLTFLIVADTRLRFDRIAGRQTEGKISVAFDDLLYGRPMGPVAFDADGVPMVDGPPVEEERPSPLMAGK